MTSPARPRAKPPSTMRTFAHLAAARRVPSEYEVATSKLLYYPPRGFEVETPLSRWYEKYQKESPLFCDDWDGFVDPRETTYSKYTSIAHGREAYTDGLLERIETTGYDAALSGGARDLLERTLPVMRFPVHGLQMLAAYVGQMAPSGRITTVFALEAADEVRRIQRLAYRMTQLGANDGFGAKSRDAWQAEPAWQPLREVIERALVAYDWGESFVALAVCIKPLFDELFMVHLSEAAKAHGDAVLGLLLGSLYDDCVWHRDVARTLCMYAVRTRPENRAALEGWARTWTPLARRAAAALCPVVGGIDPPELDAFHQVYLAGLGLEVP